MLILKIHKKLSIFVEVCYANIHKIKKTIYTFPLDTRQQTKIS